MKLCVVILNLYTSVDPSNISRYQQRTVLVLVFNLNLWENKPITKKLSRYSRTYMVHIH